MRTSHVHLFSKDRANSKSDYKKFLDFFKRPAEVFPQSPLVGRAKIWIGIIWIGIKRLNREIKELDEAIKKSKRVDMSAAEL
jgi:hypothetical protein